MRFFLVVILSVLMPRRTLSKYFQAIKFVAVNGISAALLNLLSNHFIKRSLLIFCHPPLAFSYARDYRFALMKMLRQSNGWR